MTTLKQDAARLATALEDQPRLHAVKAAALIRKLAAENEALKADAAQAEAAVIKRLAAGVSVEPASMQFQTRTGAWCDFINDKHRDDTIADGAWPIRSLYTATAIAAARARENARIADWYYNNKHRLSVFEVPDAIRALLGKEQS